MHGKVGMTARGVVRTPTGMTKGFNTVQGPRHTMVRKTVKFDKNDVP